MKHLDLKIYGKVQMVFFRVAAKEMADSLGITGFVRNEPDGELYLEIEGHPKAVKKFLSWCKKGPRSAKVKKIQTKAGKVKGYQSFDIEYTR